MNNLDFYFNQQLDPANINLQPEHKDSIEKTFDFVKGSDFHTGYYDQPVVNTIYIRYYQIALFNDYPKKVLESGIAMVPPNGKRCVRSFLLKGKSSNGACFFDYQVVNVKDHHIPEKKLNTFIDCINSQKLKSDENMRINYKFYPVYNFDYTDPPSGSEINECVSELLYNS